MAIPKQPRTKSSDDPGSQGAAGSSDSGAAPPPPPAAALPPPSEADPATEGGADADQNQDLLQTYKSSAERLNTAYLEAQKEQVTAYLTYLDSFIQTAKQNVDPGATFLQEVVRSQADPQAATDANHRFESAHLEQQSSGQKALTDATTAYLQSVQESYQKLDQQMRQHNQTVAEALKQALIGTEVRPDDAPALAALYQSMRTMGGYGGGGRSA